MNAQQKKMRIEIYKMPKGISSIGSSTKKTIIAMEQTILTQAIVQMQEQNDKNNMSRLSPSLQAKAKAVLARYGDRMHFIEVMNPSIQHLCAQNTMKAFFGSAPTLGLLDKTYGENTSLMWLLPQLFELGEFCGCKEKMDAQIATECARIIKQEFGFLKVTELMLFFNRVKAGRYGQIFFGSVDPMKITLAIRQQFLQERERAIAEKENQIQKEEREAWAKDAMSPEEFCRLKGYPECHNVLEVIKIMYDGAEN